MKRDQQREMRRLNTALTKWRSQHSRPTPIPDEIWSGAARLAAEVGVSTVVQQLKLGYTKLKKLAESITEPEPPTGNELATFVEFCPKAISSPQVYPGTEAVGIAPKSSLSTLSCAFEVESPSGSFLRAKLEGVSASDLGVVLREFGR